MKETTGFTLKGMMLVVAMLAMVGAVYAAFPNDYPVGVGPREGDYWYNYMAGTGRITYLNGWNYYDGKQWVDATTRLADQPKPFEGNIYLSNTCWLDDDFTLAGNIISNPEDPDRNIRLTVKGNDRVFTLTETGSVTAHSILIVDNATFINYGTVTLPYTDADSKLIVEYGNGDQTGGHLDNYGTINIHGLLHCGYESSIASHEGGVIQGPGRMGTPLGPGNVPYPGDIRISIANEGGWDAAFQLATYNVAPLNFTFNGNADQVTGASLPQPVYRLTVDSGHTLTLSDNITMEADNNIYNELPDFTVKSGSTLDTGPYYIVSEKDRRGDDRFILESGATIITGHAEGISSYPTGRDRISTGAVQTTNATYSSGANYHYNGDNYQDPNSDQVQFSGCFFTDDTDKQHRVHDLIIHNGRGLNLCKDFRPLTITGSVSASANTDPTSYWGYVQGGVTLSVTLSYFNAVFNGFDSVALQWETQTETNNMGFSS